MLRFDVNLSTLFREHSFQDRFDQAARSGFDAVEFWWPAGEDLDALVRRARDAKVQVVLFNLDAGDMASGERGLLNDPTRMERFRENVPIALDLAHRLGCRRLNALAGHWRDGVDRESQLGLVRENLAWAAEQAASAGVTLMLEAVNSIQNGPYLFTRVEETLRFIDSVGAPNLEFQFDVYHLQRMEGNLVANLRAHASRVGHIQVADSPDRHEPGTGELNFRYILSEIEMTGYPGYIGLEYLPKRTSAESFGWLPEDRRGEVALESLRL